MATEKRLKDADALKVVFDELYDDAFMQSKTRPNIAWWEGYSAGVNWGRNTIADAPTVDAVEVVRCCNCSYWNPRYETMGMCMKHNSIVTFTKPDFYCAWGKGKNDGICKED